MQDSQLLLAIKQWTTVYYKSNPFDTDSSATGFCTLPISLTNSYYCQVFVNYFDNSWSNNIDNVSEAVTKKRHANFILDTNPSYIARLNGFKYGLDFSPTVGGIGFGYYALVVCI